ncbi:MAG: glycoside hydrolase family 57 protein, partial [Dictyoglomus sp.]
MNKLYVAFIRHMHQPYYKDVSKNVSIFPWVRLHAIKNYYNMVSILKAFPRIKQTFNLVPSLLLQIKEYIKGETTDLWLEKTLKRVKDLTIEDKKFILENFFLLNKEKMGFVFPRYKELYDKKIRGEDYNEQDFLDLQVLYNLAWFDPELRTLDSFLNYLRIKGQNFTEEEKIKLIEKQFEVMKELFGLYKSFQESGQIEIIFSPFFHPIMPLLINTESAKFSTPELPLPFVYFSFVEDAKRQLKLGKEFYKELFDKEPYGMWPSEQAVSPELVELISEFNIRWIVTDEKVLFKTLGKEVTRDKNGFVLEPEILYKPYKLTIKDKEVFILFRDQFLSDRIGFVYMNYPPMEGAKDFYHRLLKIKESLP